MTSGAETSSGRAGVAELSATSLLSVVDKHERSALRPLRLSRSSSSARSSCQSSSSPPRRSSSSPQARPLRFLSCLLRSHSSSSSSLLSPLLSLALSHALPSPPAPPPPTRAYLPMARDEAATLLRRARPCGSDISMSSPPMPRRWSLPSLPIGAAEAARGARPEGPPTSRSSRRRAK